MSMSDIERRAKALAEYRERLAALVSTLNAGIEALQREQLPAIRRAVNSVAERHDQLRACIEENPGLFVKPKTVVLHGVKLGYQKGKGSIEFDDAEQLIKLIKKHHPESVDVLIAVKETPVKDALVQLSAQELKRLGVTVEGTSDVVLIKFADSSVDKAVKALLKAAVDEAQEVGS